MKKDLIKGGIFKTLITLALPIMGTSFLQMAYNMTDMIWLGRVGSKAVAAAGTAGFYMWLSFAFVIISKIGTEIKVSQNLGKGNCEEAEKYGISGFQFNILIAILYALCMFFFKERLIAFFDLSDKYVIDNALDYLSIVTLGMVFAFTNPLITGIFNGYGDTKTPFLFNTVGLIANMILDPVLILGFGPIAPLGVKGAGIATVLSQVVVTLVFLMYIKSGKSVLGKFHFFYKSDIKRIKEITKLGIPVAIQSALFTIFSMYIAKIVAFWGPVAIAAQKVGAQIESISWMTAGGFQGALSTFTGQNYGAKNYKRIEKGFYISMVIMGSIGLLASLGLLFFAREIFTLFISEKETIEIGTSYLRIISISQIFMCIEITTGGAFNGMGKTMPPSIISIVFNALRIPIAIYLSKTLLMGLDGVWWSIGMSSIVKGIVIVIWFLIIIRKVLNKSKNEV